MLNINARFEFKIIHEFWILRFGETVTHLNGRFAKTPLFNPLTHFELV